MDRWINIGAMMLRAISWLKQSTKRVLAMFCNIQEFEGELHIAYAYISGSSFLGFILPKSRLDTLITIPLSSGNAMRVDDGITYEFDGIAFWFKDDRCHRTDGPAIIHADGSREWFQNGKRHREDGPAVEWSNGDREWWINGKRIDPIA